MTRVAIGVHADSDFAQLRETLEAVARNTRLPYELVVIPDGDDPDLRRGIETLEGVRILNDGAPGRAAALNRLMRWTDAPVGVLLESSARVAPRWLDHLLRALELPKTGMTGPSTNRSWNAQGVFRGAGGSETEIAQTAAEAERRFGATTRTLEPLYSLAEFCYAIKREAFDAVGGADEQYGRGPCWEMDINIRAQRAGFDGLWVCAAYVWRAEPAQRRLQEENRQFDANKRRYQNKFCGAILRGERQWYRPHCRGDACPNFAPAPQSMSMNPPATAPRAPVVRKVAAPRPPARAVSALPTVVPLPAEPLVSCIMPTHDRRAFIPAALRCFLSQDYPRLELVIVDDGTDPVGDLLPDDPRIVYVRPAGKSNVGAKRNLACERANGEVIVHWDDDDWSAPSRVRRQVNALRDHNGEVCGSSTIHYIDRDNGRAYTYNYTPTPKIWLGGLAYRRDSWARVRFAEVQVGEDTQFVRRFPASAVVDLRDPSFYVASIHRRNTSPKRIQGALWKPAPLEEVLAVMSEDPPPVSLLSENPLVSCIMPTHNRRAFMTLALERFHEQTWPNRELIVVDDGTDAIEDLVRSGPSMRYIRLERRASIGAKRNLAVNEARGEIIAHWDDDDWYARTRLAMQAAPILRGEADVTALVARHLFEAEREKFWTITPELHRTMFVGDVSGGTLMYRRAIWAAGIRYPPANLAEDASFLRRAMHHGNRLARIDEEGAYVYVRHGMTSWRFPTGSFIRPAEWSETTAPPGFSGDCLRAYAEAARRCRGAA